MPVSLHIWQGRVGGTRDIDRGRELAEQIRRWRVARGYTQAELESRAGLAHNALSRIENGLVSPRLETVESIAQALEISVEELQFREPKTLRVEDSGRAVPDTELLVQRLKQLAPKRRKVVVTALVNLLDQLGAGHG